MEGAYIAEQCVRMSVTHFCPTSVGCINKTTHQGKTIFGILPCGQWFRHMIDR